MDHHAFVVHDSREATVRGLSVREAVRVGVERSAGTVTAAAVVMVSVFAALHLARPRPVRGRSGSRSVGRHRHAVTEQSQVLREHDTHTATVTGRRIAERCTRQPTPRRLPLVARSWSAGTVPGASSATVRVTHVNANWSAGEGGTGGGFELLVVTEDEQRHTLTPTAADATALFAMVTASPVLLWDPDHRTLIGANIVGNWLPLDWSATPAPHPDPKG